MKYRLLMAFFLAVGIGAAVSCTKDKPLGSADNPVQLWFMPLKNETVFKEQAPVIETYLEQRTGLEVETTLASSFLDIVKAFGKDDAHLAFMNTLGYLLSNDWSGTQPLLQYIYGDLYRTYRGEIVARVGSGIEGPKDLDGRSFAFVTPYSAAGYLYPLKYLKDHGIEPSKMEFAGGHIKAIERVYRGDVDAAATYHEKPGAEGSARDARIELKDKYPDILTMVKIVGLTDEIPNGPIAVHKDMPGDMQQKIKDALTAFAQTADGRSTLMDLYNITGLAPVDARVYEPVGTVIKEIGKTIQQMVPGGKPYYRTWIVPGLE